MPCSLTPFFSDFVLRMAAPTSRTSTQSAENWVAKSLLLLIGGIGVLGTVGFMFNNHIETQQREAEQARTMSQYEAATRPKPAPTSLPASFLESKAREQRLREHPLVTPGQGFNAPGVQETGIAIVDAIDQHNARKP